MNEYFFSLWITEIFPGSEWPVYSAVVQTGGSYFLRLRDSKDNIKLLDFKEVPKDILKDQSNIKKLYDTNKDFARYFDRS